MKMSSAAPLLLASLAFTACRRDMFDQPKLRPLGKSEFYADGRSARPVPAGTFRFEEADQGERIERGTASGNFAASIPIAIDEALVKRGQERFNVYCSPCHGRVGDGHGMVAKRGFLQPANLNGDRVRNAPPGYIYAVIANGYGSMPEYADALPVRDRWAVVAYIRALELSRRASPADVPPAEMTRLENAR